MFMLLRMDQAQPSYPLRGRRSRQPDCLDKEDGKNRPSYLEPWIVNLLLEYKETVARTDGQLGQVLKVLKVPSHAEQCPGTALYIGDGHHYIEVLVADGAVEKVKSNLSQSGLSGIIGQFIILQNYRVCFKEATQMEDCRFYIYLDCFRVMPMKRQEKRLRDCNRELSVLEKIKELWQKTFNLQTSFNSAPSVSQVLTEINQNQLNTLKQNAKDCLDFLDSSSLLDSEQLAAYPATKWQMERKQDKIHQDIFTVPAKFLMISAENEAALSKSYASSALQAVPDTDENSQDDDHSTVYLFNSRDSGSLDGSLENPWDFPGITSSSSSETFGTSPGLPQTQQKFLASPAEEESPCSSTPDVLELYANMSHCGSEQVAPKESPQQLHSCNSKFLKRSGNQESGLSVSTAADQASKTTDSIPCVQPLKKSHHHIPVLPYSPIHHPTDDDFFLGPSTENRKDDCLPHAQGAQLRTRRARQKCLEIQRKCVGTKRKHEEELSETFSCPSCSNQEALGQSSTGTVTKSNKINKKPLCQCAPLKFVSTPKKRQFKEIQDQESCVPARCRFSERLLGKKNEQKQVRINRKSKQFGVQQRECVERHPFYFTYSPTTPDLCSQVQTIRISEALIGWARWVFSNAQKQ